MTAYNHVDEAMIIALSKSQHRYLHRRIEVSKIAAKSLLTVNMHPPPKLGKLSEAVLRRLSQSARLSV